MKKIKSIVLSAMLLSTASVFAAPKPQYIQVQNAVVKAKASQFAAGAGNLKYGDEVTVIEVTKDKTWTKISSSDGKIQGWVPTTSLTQKKLIVKVASKSSANASELALAGKGLDKSFEKIYSDMTSISFALVDKIESYSCSDKDVIAFIKEGQLNEGGEK